MPNNETFLAADTAQGIGSIILPRIHHRGCHSQPNGDLNLASDKLLTLEAKSGNTAAFDELSRRHSKRVQRHIYRLLRNWDDTEDVLQDSLLKAFTHIGQFRNDCRFSTWLTRIAINSALMVLRKKRRLTRVSGITTSTSPESPLLPELPDLSPNPELLYAERQAEEALRCAILQLPWCFRSVTELYLAKDGSTSEVAQTLGISVGAVKSRLLRAKKRLRTSLPELRNRIAVE